MSDREQTGKPALRAQKKFLVLFHLTKREQTAEQWTVFVTALHQGKHLIGGSALAKPRAIKKGKPASAKCASVGGYMVITAPSIAKVRALMEKSPTHLGGGLVDVFPLVLS
jgi:hypothetical protein